MTQILSFGLVGTKSFDRLWLAICYKVRRAQLHKSVAAMADLPSSNAAGQQRVSRNLSNGANS